MTETWVLNLPPSDWSLMVLALVALAFAGALALGGLLAVMLALAPNLTARAAIALSSRTVLSFFLGLGIVLGITAVSLAAAHAWPPLGIVPAAATVLLVLLALVASSEALGRKLHFLAGREGSRLSHFLWGYAVLALASFCWPLTFVVPPAAVVLGAGALAAGGFARGE